jgi:ankyrin repeat protein
MAGARVDERDQYGHTALHEVSYQGNAEGVKLTMARALLDAGAEIDATDNAGETPLTLAYERQRYNGSQNDCRKRRGSSVVQLPANFGE